MLLLSLVWLPQSFAEPLLRVGIYSAGDGAVQREVIKALESALIDSDTPVQLHHRNVDERDPDAAAPVLDLRVAIGTRAAEALSTAVDSTPRLYGFVPRLVWQRIQACCAASGGADAALFLDRPPAQYLQLARALVPAAQRIGVLLGPSSKSAETSLRLAASQAGLELVVGWVETEDRVGTALRPMLGEVDVLLALPDPVVFNRDTVYSVLLASYSARLPVVAYSSAMVRAGSAASVFLSPLDAGRDLAAEILRFARLRRLGPARGSPGFSIETNRNVLRSLRIDVERTEELVEQVREGAQ